MGCRPKESRPRSLAPRTCCAATPSPPTLGSRSGWSPRGWRAPFGFALVVAEGTTLLGRFRKVALDGDPAARAEQVMEAGPSTVRADRPLAERLRDRGLRTAVVTAPDGRLLGVVRLTDMEARLADRR
jgi:hypothetical protein